MNNLSQRLEFDLILERIAHYASFSLGKDLVLNTVPVYSKLQVSRDLDRMRDALKATIINGSLSFGGVSDVSMFLSRAKKGATLDVDEIIDVGRFAQGVARLKKQFFAFEGEYPYLNDLFESLVEEDQLIAHIEHSFGEHGIVLDRASKELTEIRQSIRSLEKTIDSKTQEFLVKNKAMLSENVVSLQNGRQTFLIKPSEKNKMDGVIYGTSASGQSVYFEPSFLARFQNELSSLHNQESLEIERICQITSSMIAEVSFQLEANLETAALIDSIFAKASWGQKNDATVATLTTDSLRIVNARHPLIDPKTVVPNTYQMMPPHRMILISGPNTGGKSVSLKTIGLSVMMTLAGCPICCESAEIMLVDQIFVDIGDQQSIEKSLSSFSAHLETMTEVSEKATNKSLVLLDELGSQTDPLEGESLSMAILDHFRNVGCWVVATTHFSRLKQYGTQYDDILVSSVEFDLQKLMPTYRYRENVMGESNAFAIAKRLGLSERIIDQAFKYKQESQYETEHLMEILEEKIVLQEKKMEELELEKETLKEEYESLERAKEEAEKQLELDRLKLLEENDQILNALVSEAETKLETLNTTHRPDLRQSLVKEIKQLQTEVVDEAIKVGDRVKLKSTGQVGTVESIERKTAFVSIGGLKVSINLSKLDKLATEPVVKKRSKVRRSHSVSSVSSMKLELNVIGKRVNEALPLVDKYIDECVIHKVTTCRIVHGHGTGTLRNAVHDALRRNKHVRSFELASLSEGGSGATVVSLK